MVAAATVAAYVVAQSAEPSEPVIRITAKKFEFKPKELTLKKGVPVFCDKPLAASALQAARTYVDPAGLIVVAVGGTSSITGPLLAALLLGVADVAGKYYVPKLGAFIVYALMIAILIWRPQGLFVRKGGQ